MSASFSATAGLIVAQIRYQPLLLVRVPVVLAVFAAVSAGGTTRRRRSRTPTP